MKKIYSTHITAIIFILIAVSISSCSKKNNPNPTPQDIAPTITSLSITQGSYNTSVIITGTGFSTNAANDQVFFNGKVATVTATTGTTLTVSVPKAAGTGVVSVAVNNGTRVTGPVFTYEYTYVASVFAGDPLGSQGSVDGVGVSARFKNPYDLVVDATGNVFVADLETNKIRKITPDGIVSTYANVGTPAGLTIDRAGNLYFTDLSAGHIKKITAAGVVTTIAGNGSPLAISGPVNGNGADANFNDPAGITIDAIGNLYVADQDDNLIRKITPSGIVSTFAGEYTGPFSNAAAVNGPGSSATFKMPRGIAIDASGNLYIADTYHCLIRKITTDGTVSTLAGVSNYQGSADGIGTAASFNLPTGVAIDPSGNILVADQSNYCLRKITPAGVVSTIKFSFSGFFYPESLITDATGNIYVSNNSSNIIKLSIQ